MAQSIRNIAYLFILFNFISCQELYDANLDNSRENFLVVEGRITNNPIENKIRLTRAIGFNENEQYYGYTAVTNAIVTISDNLGNTINLFETGNGYYSAEFFSGTAGITYTLKIITSDGEVYESVPEKMEPAADSVKINAELASIEIIDPSILDETRFIKKYGVNIIVDVKSNHQDATFYKFETRVITEKIHAEFRSGRCAICPQVNVHCTYLSKLEDLPTIQKALVSNGTSQVKHLNLGFLEEGIYNPDLADEIKDPPRNYGWILSCKVSTLSEKEFIFYSKLREQLAADNKIFDPLPTQLKSNIKCTSDPTKTVLGYFSVSSQFNKDYFVKYNRFDRKIVQRDVFGIPYVVEESCLDFAPPPFWIFE
ncbi:MAG: DUF4249 domain-containing protein [Bacteroidales bacterium]